MQTTTRALEALTAREAARILCLTLPAFRALRIPPTLGSRWDMDAIVQLHNDALDARPWSDVVDEVVTAAVERAQRTRPEWRAAVRAALRR